MGLNITNANTAFQFERREQLRQDARSLLNRQGASSESIQRIVDDAIFKSTSRMHEVYPNAQLAILSASGQISNNNSMKETLNYLRTKAAAQKTKKAVFGELWSALDENNDYQGELLNFEIDESAQNIFAAA